MPLTPFSISPSVKHNWVPHHLAKQKPYESWFLNNISSQQYVSPLSLLAFNLKSEQKWQNGIRPRTGCSRDIPKSSRLGRDLASVLFMVVQLLRIYMKVQLYCILLLQFWTGFYPSQISFLCIFRCRILVFKV